MSKLTLAAAAAVGYVFGTRAGREKYDQLAERASSLWNSDTVQKGATRAQEVASEKAPKATEKITGALGSKGGSHRGDDDTVPSPDLDTTATTDFDSTTDAGTTTTDAGTTTTDAGTTTDQEDWRV